VGNLGLIEVRDGGRFEHTTSNFVNYFGGRVLVQDANARFNGFINAYDGRISLDGGALEFNGGLDNSGQLLVTFGGGEILGDLTTQSGGKIILSGNSQTTFYDMVDVKSGGELRVSNGSSAVFFGQVTQRTGSLFTGSGSKFYEGGLSVGASPGAAYDAGDVGFGAGNVYLAEIGGTLAGTEHDFYDVAGLLTLGGTLELVSWDGYVGQAGDQFDLFDWGTLSGTFDVIDSDGFVLAAGTTLDTSRLYIDGSISVTAVPEPETYALLLAGLGLVGFGARRRKTATAQSKSGKRSNQ